MSTRKSFAPFQPSSSSIGQTEVSSPVSRGVDVHPHKEETAVKSSKEVNDGGDGGDTHEEETHHVLKLLGLLGRFGVNIKDIKPTLRNIQPYVIQINIILYNITTFLSSSNNKYKRYSVSSCMVVTAIIVAIFNELFWVILRIVCSVCGVCVVLMMSPVVRVTYAYRLSRIIHNRKYKNKNKSIH
eukprot:GHVR01098849.1.p2 GENE.GHVR01098849.1~~GHVR01098849.1.p2  ORF type:complete len:185 (+),score=46.57 GHVR01098849.1:1096-1650(+)